jgi:MtN3 and saliva related transmembrane protein
MGLAPLLQVRVIVRERDASGISLGWVLILLVGFMLWFSYGIVNDDLPIIISNAVAIVVTTTLVVTVRIYARRPEEAAPAS